MTSSKRCRYWAPGALLIVGLLLAGRPGWAQDEPAGADPFGSAGAAKPAAGAESPAADDAPQEPAEETNPLVLAIQQSQLDTPAQQLQAAATLVRLQRPELARPMLRQLLEADLEVDTLAQLQRQFGSTLFLRLARHQQLQPEGGQLAKAVAQATSQLGQDPEQLARLIDQLADSERAVVRAATGSLLRAGPAALPALIKQLGNPRSANQLRSLQTTLVAVGTDAIDPLIAGLQAPEADFQARVAQTLGQLKARRAVPALLAPAWAPGAEPAVRQAAREALQSILGSVPSQKEAIRYLKNRLEAYFAGTLPGPLDEADRVAMWSWDQQAEVPEAERLDVEDAILLAAARTAERLHRLAPEDHDYGIVRLLTGLAVAQRRAGLEQPLEKDAHPVVAEAAATDLQTLQEVLTVARDKRLVAAAIAVLRVLEQSPDPALLPATGGQLSPVVRALSDRNRRVRYAAARVLEQLDPQQPYPGSSYLTDVLANLAATGGQPAVLIAHPKLDVARGMAALLGPLGLQAEIATTPRRLLRIAADNPDIAFILVADALGHPGFAEVIQILRQDAQTGELPIGLIVRDLADPRIKRLIEQDPLTLAFAQPLTEQDMALETRRLLEAAGQRWIPPEQRVEQARFALETMIHWAENPEKYEFYDLLAHQDAVLRALSVPPLSSLAARLLGLLATPNAQQTLVEFASQVTNPVAARKAAAEAFAHAVKKRHLLLTRDQVLRQYDRYNASRDLDSQTQQILGSILDAMEGPIRKQQAGDDQPGDSK
jgi:hypothetical protein